MRRVRVLGGLAAAMPVAAILLSAAAAGFGAEAALEGLVEEALANNAELRAARKRYEAARLRPPQVSSLPETMFSAGYTSNGRPWPGAGLGAEPTSNAGFMATQEFPAPGKRRLRGAIAGREAAIELQQYHALRLSVVSRLKQAWYTHGYTRLAADVLERNRSLLEKLLKIAEIRYSVGKAAQQDSIRVRTQLAILETKLVQLERERRARAAEMLGLLNRRPGEALEVEPGSAPPAITSTLDDLLAAANRHAPSLAMGQEAVERNQLALGLARKDFFPDYAISGGYFNMGRMPDMFQARVDFKLPTSWFRKQRPAVAEQAALVMEARRQLEASAQSLAFRIQDEFLSLQASQRLMKLYEQSVVPLGTVALESSLASYETGAVDLLSVMANFLTILDYQMSYYDERRNAWLAVARLEELTGVTLAGAASPDQAGGVQ